MDKQETSLAPGVAKAFDKSPIQIVPLFPDKSEDGEVERKVIASEDLEAGTLIVREHGISTIATESKICRMCFSEDPRVHAESSMFCAHMTKILSFEGRLAKSLLETPGGLEELGIDSTIVMFWARLLSVSCAIYQHNQKEPRNSNSSTATTRAVDQCLKTWEDVLLGCQELMMSAPTQEWIVDMATAAVKVWGQCDEEVQAAMEYLLREKLTRGPFVTVKEGKPQAISGPEALVVFAGQINRNGYSVRSLLHPNTILGMGLFPAIAMLNHSCYPNCTVVTCPGGILEVRTLRKVPKMCELTSSYCNLLQSRRVRRADLLYSKNFECHCLRCDSPDVFEAERYLTTPLCVTCKCNVPRETTTTSASEGDMGTFVCRGEDGGCGAILKGKTLQDVTDMLEGKLHELHVQAKNGKHKTVLLDAKQFLKEVLGVHVSGGHIIIMQVRLLLARTMELQLQFANAAREVAMAAKIMETMMPACWPELIELRSRQCELYLSAAQKESPEKAMYLQHVLVTSQAAKTALQACVGSKHPLVQNLKQQYNTALHEKEKLP
eukprot:m.103349 g.103349  ORF g.103349 m.103349 type:complete len:551 (+) comp13807_c0_seq5:244-1896(+)